MEATGIPVIDFGITGVLLVASLIAMAAVPWLAYQLIRAWNKRH